MAEKKNQYYELEVLRRSFDSLIEREAIPSEHHSSMCELLDSLENRITRLEEDRAKRHDQNLQMEQALCYAQDAISITNADGNTRLVNPAFEAITGFIGTDFIGTDHSQIWADVNDANRLYELRNSLRRGDDWRGVLNLKKDTGEQRIVDVAATPIICSRTGTVSHHVYTIRDITHERKVEADLIRQKEFLEQLMEQSPNGIIVLSAQGEQLLTNRKAEELLCDLEPHRMVDFIRDLMRRMEGEARVIEQIQITAESGEVRYLYLQGEVLKSGVDTMDGANPISQQFLFSLTDVTEQELKNQEILLQHKILHSTRIERELMQRELANGLVYQMQQPLNVFKAVLAGMRFKLNRGATLSLIDSLDQIQVQLDTFQTGLERFKRLTEVNLPEGEKVEAQELSAAVRVIYHETCQQSGIDLELLCESPGIRFPLTLELMQLLLICLMDNAVESVAQQNQRRVRMTLFKTPNQIGVCVEDSGPGVQDEDRLKIFEPFYTTKEQHNGLSLSFLFHTLNRLGGRVQLKSSELGGASFTLCFPKEKYDE